MTISFRSRSWGSLTLLCALLCVLCACTEDSEKSADCAPLPAGVEVGAQGGEAPSGGVGAGKADEVCEEAPACPELVCPELECPEGPAEPERRSLNLRLDDDNLYAWRKTRASLNPEEDVVFYWVGYVYNQEAKDPANFGPNDYNVTFESPLFRFEGFNVARFAEDPAGGYTMLSREVSVYQDPNTGAVIDCWRNPLLEGRPEVQVMHVANDPVNFGVGSVNYIELGDRVSFFSDVLISYRSPLAGSEELSPYSASDVYQSNELFNFYASRADLENEALDSVPVEISWSRVGQYLPWMQMGDRPGQLVYHVRGYKVMGGVDALPDSLKQWTLDVAGEEFMRAPEEVPQGYTPNATTWRVFKAQLESGDYTPTCNN